MPDDDDEPPALGDYGARVVAAADIIRRTGAHRLGIRVCDDDDGLPPAVLAFAVYTGDEREQYEVGAGSNPLDAVTRLLHVVVDGGLCLRCGRAMLIARQHIPTAEDRCVMHYDEDTNAYVRRCGA